MTIRAKRSGGVPEGWHSGLDPKTMKPWTDEDKANWPSTAHLRPNFEGIGEDEDPDAYDRERDRRRGG